MIGKALLGMVAGNESRLLGMLFSFWREMLLNGEQARRDKEMNEQLTSEMRRYRERQRAVVLSTVSKWGSELRSVALSSVFFGWRDLLRGAKQLRLHAERVFARGWADNAEVLLHVCLDAWGDWRRDLEIQRQRERQTAMISKALLGMMANGESCLLGIAIFA